jgi:hypothetical protein
MYYYGKSKNCPYKILKRKYPYKIQTKIVRGQDQVKLIYNNTFFKVRFWYEGWMPFKKKCEGFI